MNLDHSLADLTAMGLAPLQGEVYAMEDLIRAARARATSLQANMHTMSQEKYKDAYDERKQILDAIPGMEDRLRRCRVELKKREDEIEAALVTK